MQVRVHARLELGGVIDLIHGNHLAVGDGGEETGDDGGQHHSRSELESNAQGHQVGVRLEAGGGNGEQPRHQLQAALPAASLAVGVVRFQSDRKQEEMQIRTEGEHAKRDTKTEIKI